MGMAADGGNETGTEAGTPSGHACLSCRPGPLRLVDHDRHSIRIPRRFRGPPNSGNGGVAAGIFACIGAAALGSAARSNVRLHRPPPLDADLPYAVSERAAGGVTIEVHDDDGVVLSGWASDLSDRPVPETTIAELAQRAELDAEQRAAFDSYVEQATASTDDFKGCFVCGPEAPGGLHLRPRPVGDGVSWLTWHPEVDWIEPVAASQSDPAPGSLGLVPAIAALDCTSAVGLNAAGVLGPDESVLLGTYDAEVTGPLPVPDERGLRVITRPRGRDGRKVYTDIGLFSPDGEAHVLGKGTWIVVSADTAAGRS